MKTTKGICIKELHEYQEMNLRYFSNSHQMIIKCMPTKITDSKNIDKNCHRHDHTKEGISRYHTMSLYQQNGFETNT